MTMEAHGERWFANETPFKDQMKDYWGEWGLNSEIGKLRAVLLRRPGSEIEGMEQTYKKYRWLAPMDPVKAREEHDQLAQIYRDHGATVHYLEETGPYPNAIYMRDTVVMTPEGAIVSRMGIDARRGEEKYVAKALANLDIPIIKTINGTGIFEGACLLWVDKESVLIGVGNRSNAEGVRQVEEELKNIGVTNICRIQVPFGNTHIDGAVNIADKDVAAIFPWHLPHEAAVFLMDRGFKLIECNWPEESEGTLAVNFVALEPGKVVMPSGNHRTKDKLEKAGVEVVEIDVTEILKGWGAIHCMTGQLSRDEVE